MSTVSEAVAKYEDEHRFAREPEEDRRLLSPMPWQGGYRWFRSPNVICLEKYWLVLDGPRRQAGRLPKASSAPTSSSFPKFESYQAA